MRYVVLLPGDESAWATATPAERTSVYRRHEDFARELARRGHQVIGGAELTHSSRARVLRVHDGTSTVTDGPFAETVEQLTGYYEIESDDPDDLIEVCAVLAGLDQRGTGAVEIRQVVDATDGPSSMDGPS